MTNTNALNRKIEESISVGKEFEPVSQLWGKFAAMMGAGPNGLPGIAEMQAQQQQQQSQQEHAASTTSNSGKQFDGTRSRSGTGNQPPVEVAPGGGTWAPADTLNR